MKRFSTARWSWWAFTTSPMETIPTTRPSLTTGRWQTTVDQHRQVADPPRGHQAHDLLHAVVRRAGNQLGGHHLADAEGRRRALAGDHGVDQIALGDDPQQVLHVDAVRHTSSEPMLCRTIFWAASARVASGSMVWTVLPFA